MSAVQRGHTSRGHFLSFYLLLCREEKTQFSLFIPEIPQFSVDVCLNERQSRLVTELPMSLFPDLWSNRTTRRVKPEAHSGSKRNHFTRFLHVYLICCCELYNLLQIFHFPHIPFFLS